MKEQIPYNLLAKYLKGECTRDEIASVEDWFTSLDSGEDDTRLLDEEETNRLQQKMLSEVKRRVEYGRTVKTNPGRSRSLSVLAPTSFRFAAAILLLITFGAALSFWLTSRQTVNHSLVNNQELPAGLTILQNRTSEVQVHRLPDGSLIQLQPGGVVEFEHPFASDRRDVKLVGEAFFDVTKDKNRPFIINARDVMVKVLGTSFNIKAYQNDHEVKVAVKTGKVSVTRPVQDSHGDGQNEVILTPNQEVVYNKVKENFSRQLVATPQIILPEPTLFHMVYDATPVNEIFDVLEKNYGIEIVYDEKTLASCSLTTRMEEEGFYERIEIICQAIGATYEVQDAKVLISSAGCQELNH